MFKHILKIIWNQRRSNGWIFAELLIVAGVLYMMVDMFYVDIRTYRQPLGYDITNTWRFKLSEQSTGVRTDSVAPMSDPEKLTQLMEQIRQSPEVEEVCATFYSCPYSWGNSWRSIRPLDGDTLFVKERSFQIRNVTPEYFSLFRVKTPEGRPVAELIAGVHNALVLTKEMADGFYHGQSALGRQVQHSEQVESFRIAAVSSSIRSSEYERAEPSFYQCLDGAIYNDVVNNFGARSAELCVRMKKSYTQDEINVFLAGMGDRLTVDNLFVYGVSSIESFREQRLSGTEREMSNKLSLMVFMLINVFFGIIGTFWLRMQSRRGEMGLRMALGAHRITLEKYMYAEGLCLLAATFPLIILFVANMAVMDFLQSYRQPLSLVRFTVTLGTTYLLLGIMIMTGIWFPVHKAVRMEPAEALHYE